MRFVPGLTDVDLAGVGICSWTYRHSSGWVGHFYWAEITVRSEVRLEQAVQQRNHARCVHRHRVNTACPNWRGARSDGRQLESDGARPQQGPPRHGDGPLGTCRLARQRPSLSRRASGLTPVRRGHKTATADAFGQTTLCSVAAATSLLYRQ